MEPHAAVLTLLGKPDCHLCHVMAEVTRRVLGSLQAELVKQDVRDDPELNRRYARDIPVLLLDGREVARHRVDEAELLSRLVELGVPARSA